MGSEFRVLHTADTHIGYRQYGSETRRGDFLESFGDVVDDAIDTGVDVLIHAGDLFHSRNPKIPDLISTFDLFRDLNDSGIEVLAVVGNHERKRKRQWLDFMENLGFVKRLGLEPVIIDDVAFYGVDFLPSTRIDDFSYDFNESDASHNFLVMHGRFEPFPYGEWRLSSFIEETDIEWDGFMLGDYHHYEKERISGVPAVYCGSTERVSAEERESRGYNLWEINDDGVRISRKSIETRGFVFVDVELSEWMDKEEATDEVIKRALEHDVRDSVVILDVKGDSSVEVKVDKVEEAIRDEDALVVRLNDRREGDEDPGARGGAEVGFMDPDEAVQEQLDKIGLSDAAHSIEAIIRGNDVAKSNLGDLAASEVEELLENDLGVFETGDDVEDGFEVELEQNREPRDEETRDDEEPLKEDIEQGQSSMGDWV